MRSLTVLLAVLLSAGCMEKRCCHQTASLSFKVTMGEYFLVYQLEQETALVSKDSWIEQVGENAFSTWSLSEQLTFLLIIAENSDASSTSALLNLVKKNNLQKLFMSRLIFAEDNTSDIELKVKYKKIRKVFE